MKEKSEMIFSDDSKYGLLIETTGAFFVLTADKTTVSDLSV